MFKDYRNTLKSVGFVFRHFSPYASSDKYYYVCVIAAIVALTISNTVLIWLLGMPVTLLQSADYGQLQTVLMYLVAVIIFNQLLHLFLHVSMNWLVLRFIGRVRNYLLTNTLRISFPAASSISKGDLLTRLSNDIDQTQAFLIEVPLGLVSHLFTLIFYVAMLLWIDLNLALIALFFVPALYLQQRYFAPRKGKASESFFKKNGELLAFEEQSLANLRGISSFNIENFISKLHRGVYEVARKWAMRMRTIDALYSFIFNLLIYTCGIVIVYSGIQGIQDGDLVVGSLISFLLYLGYLSVPVRGFAEAPILWQGQFAAAQRVYDAAHAEALVKEKVDAPSLEVANGDITIKELNFSYGSDNPVFKNISVSIKAGETVALVGPSGSGKSTLAALLMRFYDPQSGSIFIDGTNIKEVSLASLRDNIAVVWQEPFFINDSVEANLRLARPSATEEELLSACQQSSSWEFIQKLDSGLQTQLNFSDELSVGQRQRLSIAQAFLKDAPILILDEASSALDSQSEQVIVESLQRLRKNRTTLIIAHRYSTIRSAERILYFNGDGSLIVGTHKELSQQHPGYRDALQWQTGA